jgi:squalene synthase HpnC
MINTSTGGRNLLPEPAMSSSSGTAEYIEESFSHCERLAKTHYENFSVGTRLIPRELRKHFYSVYAFCRGVDDLGDEATGDRLELLKEWESQLDLCYNGSPTHPFFVALQSTIRQFDIPRDPFNRLIEANRRDQVVLNHPDIQELLDYCDHSANPVGQIVLYIFGHREPELHRLANSTCTAHQLANFWQDVSRDYEIGRIYIPADEMQQFGVTEEMLRSRDATPEFRQLMKFQVDRARKLFLEGSELIDKVKGTARIDIALFTAGGLTVLRAIEKLDYDVLTKRPEVSKFTKFRLLISAYTRVRLGMNPLPQKLFRPANH